MLPAGNMFFVSQVIILGLPSSISPGSEITGVSGSAEKINNTVLMLYSRFTCILSQLVPLYSGGTRMFFVGASKGQNAILRGQKSKNLAKFCI